MTYSDDAGTVGYLFVCSRTGNQNSDPKTTDRSSSTSKFVVESVDDDKLMIRMIKVEMKVKLIVLLTLCNIHLQWSVSLQPILNKMTRNV